jgi:OmpR-family two-component system manganese-sensing response regulator
MLSGLLPEFASTPASIQGDVGLNLWPTLLVVDPDEDMRFTLVRYFEKRGYHVAAADSLAEVRDYFHRRKTWTLIIADYHLPDGSGSELCEWIRNEGSTTPVLLMSSSPHASTLCAGNDYLAKPFPIEKLEAYVQGVRRRR